MLAPESMLRKAIRQSYASVVMLLTDAYHFQILRIKNSARCQWQFFTLLFRLLTQQLVVMWMNEHTAVSGSTTAAQWQRQPGHTMQIFLWSYNTNFSLVIQCKFFSVYRLYKESIYKAINNDNNLNLHSMTKLSSSLRHCCC